jgi:tripartite-type tricarboxylate transporter receptor subunit TctC
MTDSRMRQGRRRMAAALVLSPLLAPLAGLQPARSWAAGAAAGFPRKPLKIAIGFAPGGSTDAPMRVLGEQVARILGQPVVIENKPGAGGVLEVQGILNAPADGYTLAIAPAGIYRLPYTQNIRWSPDTDLTYIIGLTGYAFGIVVPANSQLRTLQDYVAYAKAHPGELTYSTSGIATTNHLTMEQLSRQFGMVLNHVPYKGSADSLQALLAGQVASAAETSAFVPYVESGKLRLLAVWGDKRMARFPGVPTLQESGADIVQKSPWGLVGPRNMDPAVVRTLHDAFHQAMQSPAFVQVLERFDMAPDYRSPQDFHAFAQASMRKEKAVVEMLGLQAK